MYPDEASSNLLVGDIGGQISSRVRSPSTIVATVSGRVLNLHDMEEENLDFNQVALATFDASPRRVRQRRSSHGRDVFAGDVRRVAEKCAPTTFVAWPSVLVETCADALPRRSLATLVAWPRSVRWLCSSRGRYLFALGFSALGMRASHSDFRASYIY